MELGIESRYKLLGAAYEIWIVKYYFYLLHYNSLVFDRCHLSVSFYILSYCKFDLNEYMPLIYIVSSLDSFPCFLMMFWTRSLLQWMKYNAFLIILKVVSSQKKIFKKFNFLFYVFNIWIKLLLYKHWNSSVFVNHLYGSLIQIQRMIELIECSARHSDGLQDQAMTVRNKSRVETTKF